MTSPAKQLAPLYGGIFLFGIACGISIALTPLYLDAFGLGKEEIGTLALVFAAGLVSFALPVSLVLKRFGGRKTLVAMLTGYSLCVGAFPFMGSVAAIGAIRFLDGMFSIGVWVSSETIVLSRADKKHKGHLTSLYAIWLASGYVVGPVLATGLTRYFSHRDMFLLAAAIGLVGAAYLFNALARLSLGEPSVAEFGAKDEEKPKVVLEVLPVVSLLNRIKTSCFAAFSYGYFQASVVLFLPLYLIESKGIARNDTIILPGLFCLGMLLFSNLAGRWGDSWGHLRVVSLLSALGTFCVLGFVFVDHYLVMCSLVFAAGATFASMSPVALALVGVVVPPGNLGKANSLYNTFYASGMLFGPLLSSLIFARHGGPAMLYHLAALWTVFVVFSVVFSRDDPAARAQGTLAVP